MTTENHNENKSKSSSHTVYFLKYNSDNDKPEWQTIGVAWEHKDGLGLNLSVKSSNGHRVPMVIRKNKPKG